jgi:hypothetical protein
MLLDEMFHCKVGSRSRFENGLMVVVLSSATAQFPIYLFR